MIKLAALAITVLIVTSIEAQDNGWVPLFDGKTTAGWHKYGGVGVGSAWTVKDGIVYLDTASKGKDWQTARGGDIITDKEYKNFDLKLEWKISQGGNSGVMFGVHEDSSKYQYTFNTGPEMQILDNDRNEDGKIFKHHAGDLYDLIPCQEQAVKPVGEWNQVEVKLLNNKLDFWLNGKHVVSTTMRDDNWNKMIAGSKFKSMPGFGTFETGHIALQDHGFMVWFKNVMIKEL